MSRVRTPNTETLFQTIVFGCLGALRARHIENYPFDPLCYFHCPNEDDRLPMKEISDPLFKIFMCLERISRR